MKTKWVTMFITVSLVFSSCNGQGVKKDKNKSFTDSTLIQANQPKENIIVNKEYDKNGNLIRYDSTYSYYYSNIDGNKVAGDSIFNNFRKMFDTQYPFSKKPYFNNLFFEDSLLHYDFYKKDFFHNRFMQNMKQMDRMFWEMDSIKNKYFMEQFPKKEHKK
jgi:hypothetical protein